MLWVQSRPFLFNGFQDGRRGRTCPPAMSTTFGAGTTDGPSHVDEFGQSRGWTDVLGGYFTPCKVGPTN